MPPVIAPVEIPYNRNVVLLIDWGVIATVGILYRGGALRCRHFCAKHLLESSAGCAGRNDATAFGRGLSAQGAQPAARRSFHSRHDGTDRSAPEIPRPIHRPTVLNAARAVRKFGRYLDVVIRWRSGERQGSTPLRTFRRCNPRPISVTTAMWPNASPRPVALFPPTRSSANPTPSGPMKPPS